MSGPREITDRDLRVLRFAGEQYGLPMAVVADVAARLTPEPLASGSRETTARRIADRLESGGYARRLRVTGQTWLVPTSRGLTLAGLGFRTWRPDGWILDHVEALARLRLSLHDAYPDASWESDRAIRSRWAGSGARVRMADGGLYWPDGTATGIECELHVKKLDRYRDAVADVDPAWSAGVWWFTPAHQVALLALKLTEAGGGDQHQVYPTPEGVAP